MEIQSQASAQSQARRETTPTLTEQEMAMKDRISMLQPTEIKKMLTKNKITFDKKATRPVLVNTYMRHVARTRKQGKTPPQDGNSRCREKDEK